MVSLTFVIMVVHVFWSIDHLFLLMLWATRTFRGLLRSIIGQSFAWMLLQDMMSDVFSCTKAHIAKGAWISTPSNMRNLNMFLEIDFLGESEFNEYVSILPFNKISNIKRWNDNFFSINYLRPQKLHRNGFPPWCNSMCCFKLAGVRNFLLHIWHRLHPFALLAGSLLFGEVVCVEGWEFNERTGERGKDLLRKTTPPKDPRMCLVTFPLPTAILVGKYVLNVEFIRYTIKDKWCHYYKFQYLCGNPRETFGPFIIICWKFSGPFERFLSEALAAFCASFLVTSLSPWASLKWTDRTDLVVKFAEQCSHLNPWAPFSTEWLAMCRFKLHCWKNPKQEK